MHSECIKEEFGDNDDDYAKAQFSIAIYAGFLCALKCWEKTGDSEEILYKEIAIALERLCELGDQ